MTDIKVAIIGVGNCASSFVQGIEKYADAGTDETIPGIMHPVLGEYGIGDIKVVAAFDVDENKDLASQYGVRSVPTTVIEENGVEVSRFVGGKPKQQVIEILNG